MYHEFKATTAMEMNNHYAGMFLESPVVGGVVAMWVDLMFPAWLVLGGIPDKKVLDHYYTVVEDSGVPPSLSIMATDYLVYGRSISGLLEDTEKGHWTHCIHHGLGESIITIRPDQREPLVTLTVSKQIAEWARSTGPKIMDPRMLSLLAKGEDIELDPAHTLFLARRAHATDYYGTSWLADIDLITMSTAEVLWRLRIDVAKLRDERAFNAHYVEAAARLRDHITDYIFTQKMFPHIAATHCYGKLIPTVEWLPADGAESPRSRVLRTLEDIGVPLDELEKQQQQFRTANM